MNIHFLGGKLKMGYKTRCLISHRLMWCFGLRPCELKKTFLGLKKTTDLKTSFNLGKNKKIRFKIDNKTNDHSSKRNNDNAKENKTWETLTGPTDSYRDPRGEEEEFLELRLKDVVERAVFLDSEENNDYLWKQFALFVDRLFFILNIIGSLIIGMFMLA